VISEASEGRTRDWAVEFELFRRGMSIVMPIDPAALDPVTLVLFRTDRRMRPYKPQEDGKPARMAGYFVRAPERNFLALAIEGARDDVREIIHHEGVHWHLSAAARPLPLWLEEGLAEAFGNFRLKGNSFVIGATRPEFMRRIRIDKPMPFARLMAIEPGGLAFNGKHGEQTALFYCQSWAMVHALVFGTEGVGHLALADYIRQPAGGGSPLTEFEKGLGVTAAGLDAKLASYIVTGRFRDLTFPFDRNAVESEFAVRRIAAAEADLALGNLLVGVGRAADAQPHLARALAALPGDPRPLDALGAMSYQLEQNDDAEIHFRAAIRHGSRSYVSRYFLGQRSLREAMRFSFGPPDPTESAQAFMECLRLNPRFVPAAEALSAIVGLLPERSAEAEAAVRASAARYPSNLKIQAGIALLEAVHGEPVIARQTLDRVRATPISDPNLTFLVNEAARRLENRQWAVEKTGSGLLSEPLGR
jgi:tetratricopeptide (TPR) repeat protein